MCSTEKLSEADANLPYFHGALMNIDADQLLVNEGDFMVTMKKQLDINKLQLFLAVRLKKGIRRYEIKRTSKTAKIGGKTSQNIVKLINMLKADPIEIRGEKVVLKRAIPKGKFQLMHKDVIFQKKIGAGAYGTVYRGKLVKTDEVIAVKKLDPEGADEDGLAEMMKEARVMQLYDHPNIVKFHGFILDDLPYLLVLEYCNGGAVEDRLRDKGEKIKVPTRVKYTYMAACGMDYLHKKNCIHRDIASRNCLIHKGVVKMADFGMCRAQSVYKVDLKKPCNIRWLAPEVWDNGETRFNTDVYAFGIMMWEFFETPFKSPYVEMKAAQVKRKTRAGYRLPPPPSMPSRMVEIMSECWQVDAEKRPTAEELKEKLEEFKKKTENSITTSAPPTSVEKSKLSVSSEPTTKSVDPNKSRL
ncbi:Tyrosine-protein kinase [Caenorhabditis elegans]|uniref:Tyrosine-protein kinase n=1 Tax=Caenorhabditis elegans TaxID=6239 RepID=Q21764_CAEEL|nr:Tyrosine-protein kinase [Caenorhabditis elegans]CAA88727.1 Tyrosine-protein kinase [Caenorhabditis elegans]|eukprot:NP_496201.1 Tyrosine-protein kinase [Caenorhabditis elegans]